MVGNSWELDSLRKLIEQEMEARERAATSAIMHSLPHVPKRVGPPIATTFVVRGHGVSCCYCKLTHAPNACHVVTDVEARKQVLRREEAVMSVSRRII